MVITYLLTPWGRALLEKPTSSLLVKTFPPRFITAFTSARYLSLTSHISQIQTLHPHFRKIQLNNILTSTPGSSQWCQVSPPKTNFTNRFIKFVEKLNSFLKWSKKKNRQFKGNILPPNAQYV